MVRRHIICFGNPLHSNDGFGPAVYERLARRKRPANLRLTDAGAPGRISRPSPASIMEEATPATHCLGLGYVLRALSALPETMPAIKILAAEVEIVAPFRSGLSAPVARAVDEVAALLDSHFEAGDDHV